MVLFRLVVTTLLAVGFVNGQSPGTALYDTVSAWLPDNFNVVYVSNAEGHDFFSGRESSHLDRFTQLGGSALIGLDNSENLARSLIAMRATSSVYVADGNFRTQTKSGGLGLQARLDGCSFFRLSAPAQAEILKATNRSRREYFGKASLFSAGGKDSDSVSISFLRKDVLMVCSDRVTALDILHRSRANTAAVVKETGTANCTPRDRGVLAWGWRRFRPSDADPTSPFAAVSFVRGYGDKGAVCMGFTLESPSSANVIYLTRAGPDVQSTYEAVWQMELTASAQTGLRLLSMHFDPDGVAADNILSRLTILLLGLIIAA